MAVFVVAHGAWSSAWAWRKMRPLLQAKGHEIFTPSYTGLGERAHLANPAIDLETHIQDVIGVLEFEDLADVVLIGHSYGGMVATGVADRAPARIGQLVYLDAFVPRSGQSAFDLMSPEARRSMEERATDGWRVPPNPLPPDTADADRAWAEPRRVPQPIRTLQQPLHLAPTPRPRRSYIYCRRAAPGDPFRPYAERARQEGWPCFELDASHNPHITAPAELCDLLGTIAAKTP